MPTKILVFLIFSALALLSMRINFSALVGAENQFFTVFQFFGPVIGAFLGPVVGILTVLSAELADVLIVGKEFTLLNVARLAPMLLATYYFSTKKKELTTFIIPLIAMAAFIMHPIGRTVWFFSLYWTIPIIIKLMPKYSNNPFLKGLGATFTAHAVGGAIWIWTVPMPAEAWIGLIPVVAYERLLFAVGIGVSYIALNTAFDKLDSSLKNKVINVDKSYTIQNLFKAKA
jgi:hypothetical protein